MGYGVAPVRFGSVSMVTASPGANDPEVGTVTEENDERYMFVYNAGNSQISPGHLAVLSAVTGYSVTVSSTSMSDVAVGVCKHTTLTTGTYGWLLRRGFGLAKAAANSGIAAGDLLTVGADGVWASKLASTAYSQTIAPAIYGKAMGATASAGVADAYFNID